MHMLTPAPILGMSLSTNTMRMMRTVMLEASEASIRSIRGNRIAMIFLEPMSSLNPALTVGPQIANPCNCMGAHLGESI